MNLTKIKDRLDKIPNLINLTLMGSRLYGTDTPESDFDIKGIYVPTLEQYFSNTYKDVINFKFDEYDVEIFSINKFFWLIKQGQTMSTEMLFAPSDNLLLESKEWKSIVSNREMLLTSKLHAFIGYCKSQSLKYTNKIERFNELTNFIEFVDNLIVINTPETRLKEIEEDLLGNPILEITKVRTEENGVDVYSIFGKEFQSSVTLEYFRDRVNQWLDGYGDRVRKQSQSNKDLKSLAHSYRIATELLEVLSTGKITFPRPDKDYLIQIKEDKIPSDRVIDYVDSVIKRVQSKDFVSVINDYDEDFVNDGLIKLIKGKVL